MAALVPFLLMMGRGIAWIMRNASWIVLASLLLTITAAVFSVRLYKNLRTEFEELLPTQARSVKDLGRIRDRLESSSNLAVLVFSDHPKESKRFVKDLSKAIARDLPKQVSRVEYDITREIHFFNRRRALMIDIGDLRKVRDYVRNRINYEQDIRNPLNIFSGVTLTPPLLDQDALTEKYSGRVSDYAKFKDGYYAMDSGKVRAILVYTSGQALGVQEALLLKEGVERAVKKLDPKSYTPDIVIRYTGDIQNLVEERASLISDLEASTIAVSILVMLALGLYFRNSLGTLALICSLFAGTLWTFGLAYFVTGYLNANSAFLGSIVLGNGINFGILLLARYLEERRKHPHEKALPIAMTSAFPGTLTAALAASLSYGSLGMTSFRGFRQFGTIGLMGMLLCWIAAFTLLPALLTVLDRHWPIVTHRKKEVSSRGFAHIAASTVGNFPRGTLLAGLIVSVVLGVLASRHQGPVLETDTSRLRDRHSLEKGSGYYSRYLDALFGRYISPLVILPTSRENAAKIARKLKDIRDRQGPSSLISSVYSIKDFVPSDQAEKIEILHEIRELLPPRIIRKLSPKDAKIAKEFLSPESFREFGIEDLPPLIQGRFRERDGSVGNPVLVEPIFDIERMHEFSNQKALIDEVRQTADSVEPGTPVVGQLPLTVDMIASITVDGPRATAYSFLAVILLTCVLFRNISTIIQAQLALLLGVGWMVCAMLALNLRVNFLNFIALPITFGIGVDYGVNILTRIRREGPAHIVEIVKTTGGAVSLASLTTIIGYGSLLIAGNQGFVSFGRLAILGEVTCLTAAIFILPAYILWRKGGKPTKTLGPTDLETETPAKQPSKAA